VVQESLSNNKSVHEWMTWNSEKMQGTFVNVPERSQIPEKINEQFIVELYSK
jgi:small subunit ribosomal protein S4